MSAKLYTVIEKNFEYNDNWYYEHGSSIQPLAYQNEADAKAKARELNREHVRYGLQSGWYMEERFGDFDTYCLDEKAAIRLMALIFDKKPTTTNPNRELEDMISSYHNSTVPREEISDEDLELFLSAFPDMEVARVAELEVR